MTLKDMGDKLLESDFKVLEQAFLKLKKGIDEEINSKIALKQIEVFLKQYGVEIKKSSIRTTRITDLEDKIKKALDFLEAKLKALNSIKYIDKSKLIDLEQFLTKLKMDFAKKLAEERKAYGERRR